MLRFQNHAYVPLRQRVAFIQRELSQLKNYLTMSPRNEAIELLHADPSSFVAWLRYYEDVLEDLQAPQELLEKIRDFISEYHYVDEDDETLWEPDFLGTVENQIIPGLDDDDLQDYREYAKDWLMERSPELAPSFLYMDFVRLVKNQWLIHFTDSPYEIQKNGFTYGVDNLTHLGLTTFFEQDLKKGGGYNFAFPADAFDSDTGHLYGDFPVLFRASGIEVSHYLDNEHQVIFWGDSAKDFVVLDVVSDKSDVLWCPVSCGVKPPYCHGELDTVVDWVTNNFEQYRRVLTCS